MYIYSDVCGLLFTIHTRNSTTKFWGTESPCSIWTANFTTTWKLFFGLVKLSIFRCFVRCTSKMSLVRTGRTAVEKGGTVLPFLLFCTFQTSILFTTKMVENGPKFWIVIDVISTTTIYCSTDEYVMSINLGKKYVFTVSPKIPLTSTSTRFYYLGCNSGNCMRWGHNLGM